MNINAKWISHPTAKDEAVYIRKTFNLESIPHTAKINICGLGMYELYINGQKADDRMLTPPFTTYHRQAMYDTYDVTDLLCEGDNVLGIILGSGFFNFTIGDMIGFDHSEWKGRPRVICELISDGETLLVSDTGFRMSTGAITFNHIYLGEMYDARLEKPWAEVDFDDSDWLKPIVSRPPGGVLEPSDNLPIRISDVVEPACSWQLDDGSTVYDFGKNMSGFVYLTGNGKSGSKVTFQYSEKLNSDTRDLDISNISPYIYSDKFQTDTYIFSDKTVVGWHPLFNYQGFRYMKVTNSDAAYIEVKAAFLRADIPPAGSFNCSNDLLNRIQEAAYRATVSNFHYFPTDCPHREKLGWTGDAQVSAEQALFNLDIKDFYTQWLRMYPFSQSNSGHIPATIPRPGCCARDGFEGPVWDSAMYVIPWNIYMYTGDKRAIETVYDACKKHLDYLYTCSDGYIIDHGNGDWPVYGDRFTAKEISVTAYYCHSADLMHRFAKVLGKDDDEKKYSELKENIKKAYIDKFIKDGKLPDDTQGAYAVTLSFGLYNPEDSKSLCDNLVRTVLRTDCHTEGGILTVKHIFCLLSDIGRHDLAMAMALREDLPSFGYMLSQGATTLWESWYGGGSQNHHMFASISEWFYKHILGIKPLEHGFRRFELAPKFDCLDHAEGYHKTPFGDIKISWKKKNEGVVLNVTVPAGTTAEITAPTGYVCGVNILAEGKHQILFASTEM